MGHLGPWYESVSPVNKYLSPAPRGWPLGRGWGKELHDEEGVGLYDYGARWYDAALGRWGQVDPLAEEHYNLSPYNFVLNNPLIFLAPDGRDTVPVMGRIGGVTVTVEIGGGLEDRGLEATPLEPIPNALFRGYNPLFDHEEGMIPDPTSGIAADVIKVAETIETLTSGFGLLKESVELATTASIKLALTKAGRAGKQQRLKELADDDKVSSADRGWINQEMNQIERGKRKSIRNPPGKDLAHKRGKEAAKGFSYKHSDLQDRDLHRLQHKHDKGGKSNKKRD